MTLTRALPALLALSLLTGCDQLNGLIPQPKNTGNNPGNNPGTNTGEQLQQLTQAELKSVAAFQGGLTDAANQGAAAAGTISTLKSVAALKSVGAYRINAITFPGDLTWEAATSDGFAGQWARHVNPENNKDSTFYLKGDFTPMAGFEATGSAAFQSVGDPTKLAEGFTGTISLDLGISKAPDAAKGLEGSKLELSVTNGGQMNTLLTGTFDITPPEGGAAAAVVKGDFGVQALTNNSSWWVMTASKDANDNLTFVKLSFNSDGSGNGNVYGFLASGSANVVNYDVKHATFNWGKDGKGKVKLLPEGKEADIEMPF